ncbi:unnamed protein product, partial [marine sediment metagenome]
ESAKMAPAIPIIGTSIFKIGNFLSSSKKYPENE